MSWATPATRSCLCQWPHTCSATVAELAPHSPTCKSNGPHSLHQHVGRLDISVHHRGNNPTPPMAGMSSSMKQAARGGGRASPGPPLPPWHPCALLPRSNDSLRCGMLSCSPNNCLTVTTFLSANNHAICVHTPSSPRTHYLPPAYPPSSR